MSSKYRQQPMDLKSLKTVSVFERGGKVQIEHFAGVAAKGDSVSTLLDKMPKLLAADTLRAVVGAIRGAREKGKPVLWGMGGHVIKCGLAPVLIDLMEKGFITAFVMNGSTSIHDFEIGICGATSEDVEAVLPDGSFGSAEETGRWMNEAAAEALAQGIGLGEAYGAKLEAVGKPDIAKPAFGVVVHHRSVSRVIDGYNNQPVRQVDGHGHMQPSPRAHALHRQFPCAFDAQRRAFHNYPAQQAIKHRLGRHLPKPHAFAAMVSEHHIAGVLGQSAR